MSFSRGFKSKQIEARQHTKRAHQNSKNPGPTASLFSILQIFSWCNMLNCTFCGSPTRSLYYKCNKRQTHVAPRESPPKRYQFHTKVCTKFGCGRRFSVCNIHPDFGWQFWHEKIYYGRGNCKALMWVHNCKGCIDSQKSETTTVLCPGCKVHLPHVACIVLKF